VNEPAKLHSGFLFWPPALATQLLNFLREDADFLNKQSLSHHMSKKLLVKTVAFLALISWLGAQAYPSWKASQQLETSSHALDSSHKLLRTIRAKHIRQVANNGVASEQDSRDLKR
jgi:hypothetical protein